MFRRKSKPNTTTSRRSANVSNNRSAAFSYHANRSDQDYNLGRLQPREQDNRHRERLVRYWRQRLGMLLAGIVLIICVLDVLHLSSQPDVIALTTTSTNAFLQPTRVYAQAAQKQFASSLLNNNKITINTAGIEANLKKQFPELSDVSVTLPLMSHHPIVYIAPTTPSLELQTSSGDFVLDNNGQALLPTDQVDNLPKLHLPVVIDQSGLKVTPHQTALPSTAVAFIETVAAELQLKGVTVQKMTLPAAAYELDVQPSGAGYYIKFNMYTPTALQQVGTFLAVRQRLTSQGVTPASYVDVRVDGRAYYK